MSDRSFGTAKAPHLYGADGELVLVRLYVDPKLLEEVLDVLAGLQFPVNPELLHARGQVAVEFPAYEHHLSDVRTALASCRFDPALLHISGVLAAV